MDLDALMKLKQARSAMLVDSPFFGELALKLKLKEDLMLNLPEPNRTMWTDGVTLGYCPEFVNKVDMKTLVFAMAHESGGHCGLFHHLRRNGRDPKNWNIACDYAVNAILKKAGFHVPSWVLYDKKFEDMSADAIFDILQGKKQQDQDQQKQQQQDDSEPEQDDDSDNSEENGENADDADADQEDSGGEDDAEDGDSDDTQDSTQGEDAEGADGKSDGSDGEPGDELGDCPGGCGEVRDYPGLEEADAEDEADVMAKQEQEWTQAMAIAQIHAEQAGKMSGYVKYMVDSIIESKVDWKSEFQRFMTERVRTEHSWATANKRYTHRGVIMPTLKNKSLGKTVIIVDTSCSIEEEELTQFSSECEMILSLFDTELHVVHCDTEVRHTEDITRDDMPVHLAFHGGGGTKFSPAFQYVNQLEDEPFCVVYLTDLDCNDFGPEPDYPVLWIQTKPGWMNVKPPFGEVTKMYREF